MKLPELLKLKDPTAWPDFERGEITEEELYKNFFKDRREVNGPALLHQMVSLKASTTSPLYPTPACFGLTARILHALPICSMCSCLNNKIHLLNLKMDSILVVTMVKLDFIVQVLNIWRNFCRSMGTDGLRALKSCSLHWEDRESRCI